VIDFVILNPHHQQRQHLEFVRAAVSFSLDEVRYSPYAREFTADEIERLSAKAFRMKCPETGEGFMIAVIGMSDKVKENPECAERHVKAYLGHPIRLIIQKDIERLTAS
jgi:hypothetical protein